MADEGTTADFEDELRRVNRFLNAIFENIPDMIFVKDAATLAFQRFNRAGEELLGWSRSELIGKTDHDFYSKEQADFFHQKDREALAGGKLVDIPQEPINTRHAGLRWLHTKKVPVYDEAGKPLYLLGISEDITARKAAEERVRALEAAIAALVTQAREAIISFTPDLKIFTWNPAAEALYGVPAAQAVGSSIERLIPDSARAGFRAHLARLADGEKLPIAEVYRLRGDFEIEVEESLFAVLDEQGQVGRFAAIARDLSEITRLRRVTEILSRGSQKLAPADSHSKAMQELLEAADLVAADAHATVLLLGETGVGKGWLARRIHATSQRATKPFLTLNCASLGPQLVESELFGHERGAFTGAMIQKRGLVEVADGGTLFLDEVGELPMQVQAQLLTFLDGRTFRRVGGTRTLQANVRVLAATNVDLRGAAEKGQFRKDLYYRLGVMPLTVPPLRERQEEITSLALQLLGELAMRGSHGRSVELSVEAQKALRQYEWPGNVRELRNALERALILSRGETILVRHLPQELRGPDVRADVTDKLEDVERLHLNRVLASVAGNRTKAAEMLGISRSTLKRKLAAAPSEDVHGGATAGSDKAFRPAIPLK